MRVDNSTGKGMSGKDKFSSKVHRVHMELYFYDPPEPAAKRCVVQLM